MEPALPPLHPQVPELIEHLSLEIIEPMKWNVLLCRRAGAPANDHPLILKFGTDPRKTASIQYEVRILRDVLPQLEQKYFERLVLPEYVNDGKYGDLDWVLTKFIKGRPLLFEWSELSSKPEALGGARIGLEVARYAVDVLRDLRMVNLDTIPNFVNVFTFDAWLEGFNIRGQELVGRGIWGRETVDQALAFFKTLATERYQGNMFTNGDFYPRNFIMLPKGRIAVADWVGGVDPWEFVAMKAWIMMWGNPAWQVSFAREIMKHFPVDYETMQVGILVECADQIFGWRDLPEEAVGRARGQLLSYFHECLDINYVRNIFS